MGSHGSKPAGCTAIIPAWNEAPRIGYVLRQANASGVFNEVIVVDDGSSDGTSGVAQEHGASVIRHEKCRGKAQAMLSGLRAAENVAVCFIDADLQGLKREHFEALVGPVVDREADACLAVFAGGRAATTLAQKITPMLSGQRCLNKVLLDSFTEWDSGFGIETAINRHLLDSGVEQRIVKWHGASQVMKEEKRGIFKGFFARLAMFYEIIVVWLAKALGGRKK